MVDIPNNNTTPAVVTVNGSYTDQLEVTGDRDWVRLDLAPNQTVTILLEGSGSSPVDDTYLRVWDSVGTLVAENDDINFPSNTNSQVTLTAGPAGGTYYVDAGAYADNYAGEYTITVTEVVPGEEEILDSLDWGAAVPNNNVTVYFAPVGVAYDGVTSEGFNAYEIQQFELAFDRIEELTGLTFTIVNDPNAYIRIVLDTNELNDPTLGGYFYPPGQGSISGVGVFNGSSDIWSRTAGGQLEVGGYGYYVIVHEFMHALGMAHPHDNGGTSVIMNGVTSDFDDYGDFDLNQGVFTVLSYNAGLFTGTSGSSPAGNGTYGRMGGPMALDIALLQQLYGANTTTATGNDVYILPDTNAIGTYWDAIWDAGGTDTIQYNGTRNTTIDLRAATIEYSAGGGGFISAANGIAGGYTIAQNVVIENATGGSGSDTINGNAAANVLSGGAGVDTINGLAGNDTIIGGAGGDNLDGGDDVDTLSYVGSNAAVTVNLGTGAASGGHAAGDTFSNFENVFGSSHDDTLTGSSANNQVSGGDGDDTIHVSGGFDTINGGADIDTFDLSTSTGVVNWVSLEATGSQFRVDSGAGFVGRATLTNIENVSDSAGDDRFYGNAADNTYYYSAGFDTFDGNGGIDTLDVSAMTANLVWINLAAPSSQLRSNDGSGWVANAVLSDVERFVTSAQTDYFYGDATESTFVYVGGRDFVSGGAGADTLDMSNFDLGTWVNLNIAFDQFRFHNGAGFASGGNMTGVENVIGSDGNDYFYADANNNTYFGGLGNDRFEGGLGDDTFLLDGTLGDYTFSGVATNATVNGISGTDTLIGVEFVRIGNTTYDLDTLV
ncbi:MAG: M10 family metallopeptidase C-terminal domain-containing protein [Hyphomicrobiaceae bacterium]|nr:M10 family metallopeptidase C-terminal domain-containing protein [Hyphomicrobiaceae bacterium]